MNGVLYLCATPIGNLNDISLRVVETLQNVDLIAAEDTRNSIKLLNHFEIKTPMTSYHEYNKVDKAIYLAEQMMQGKNVALITDAGTPAISDPGEVLVQICREKGIMITSLPGPCACITALTLSGLCTRRFSFEGFLPSEKSERNELLSELKSESRTMIFYEAPHRLKKTLELFSQTFGNRKITVCRELTKKYETVMPMRLEEAVAHFTQEEPRGEFVLVLEGLSKEEKMQLQVTVWEQMSIEEHMELYLKEGVDRTTAMKKVAKDRGVTKRDVYAYLVKNG